MTRALVFDSGVGGLSVFDAIAAAGIAVDLDYLADNAWLPYGEKSDDALRARVPALIAALASQLQSDVVVVACNTASTIALDDVRAAMATPVIGVVPPIKPAAAMTKTGVIGLLATPATVSRAYTRNLIAAHAAGAHVISFGSSALVAAAEAKLRGHPVDARAIDEAIAGLFGQPGGEDIDVVALACTHFPFLAQELAASAPRAAQWVDSGAAIARRLQAVTQAPPGAARARVACFTQRLENAPPFIAARAFQACVGVVDGFRLRSDGRSFI